jgi:hypothetical protein
LRLADRIGFERHYPGEESRQLNQERPMSSSQPARHWVTAAVVLCTSGCYDIAPDPDATSNVAATAQGLTRAANCEVNYQRKSCVVENGRLWFNSADETQSQTFLTLRCEDGNTYDARIPVALPADTLANSTRYDAATCSYSYQQASNRGTVVTAADTTLRIPSGITEALWEKPADGDASLAALRRYDRTRTALREYDVGGNLSAFRPDATSASYRELINDFPHISARISWAADPNYAAYVLVFPGAGNRPNAQGAVSTLRNPIIVGDAFDPGNARGAGAIATTARYKKLLSLDESDGGPRSAAGGGRDIVFVDFAQGGGDILVNAHLFLRAYEWLLTRTPDSVTAAGISMGGIVGRLALLFTEAENNVHGQDLGVRLRGFLSVDSPHQGASIAPRVQHIACQFMAKGYDEGKENWRQLSVPAAYQMLYGHYVRGPGESCADLNWDTSAHDRFYGLLNELSQTRHYNPKRRGHRGDVTSIGIAYSNFHRPHGTVLDPNVRNVVGKMETPIHSARDWYAGGPGGDPHRYELYPGSAGDWYWNILKRKSPNYSYPRTINEETFKGTFIPINSALDLAPDYDVFAPQPNGGRAPLGIIDRASAFDRVYMMVWYDGTANANDYCSEFQDRDCLPTTNDDRRYYHVVFDASLMEAIRSGLRDIDRAEPYRRLGASSANGDAAADLIFKEPRDQSLHVNVSCGTSFFCDGTGRWFEPGGFGSSGRYLPGDFDGDGFKDLAYIDSEADVLRVATSTGSRYVERWGYRNWISPSYFGRGAPTTWRAGDFDGDRKTDFFIFVGKSHVGYVGLSTGYSPFGRGWGVWVGPDGFGSNPRFHYIGDFNGDGRSDLGYFEPTNAAFYVSLSTGSSFFGPGSGIWASGFGHNMGNHLVGDFNGDGRDDLMFYDDRAKTLSVSLSTGAAFGGPGSGMWIGPYGFGSQPRHLTGDFNGDGVTDLGYPETDNTFHVVLSSRSSFALPGGRRWIEPNGFGGTWGRYYVSEY